LFYLFSSTAFGHGDFNRAALNHTTSTTNKATAKSNTMIKRDENNAAAAAAHGKYQEKEIRQNILILLLWLKE